MAAPKDSSKSKRASKPEQDEIVRGYPVDKAQFVIVEDEELEDLASLWPA